MAMRCTQWPTSAFGSGMPSDLSPRLIGRQVLPPSSRAERARRRDGDEDALGLGGIEQDRVQAHPARARLPRGAGRACAAPGSSCQRLPAVGRAEQRGVLHARVDGVRIRRRRLEMPDARELPRVRRAVVPLMRAGGRRRRRTCCPPLPGLAAVVRALDHLPEPAARLRGVEPVRIGRRALEVVDLPARRSGGRSRPSRSRLPSDVRTNAPLRVPTSTRTVLIAFPSAYRVRR